MASKRHFVRKFSSIHEDWNLSSGNQNLTGLQIANVTIPSGATVERAILTIVFWFRGISATYQDNGNFQIKLSTSGTWTNAHVGTAAKALWTNDESVTREYTCDLDVKAAITATGTYDVQLLGFNASVGGENLTIQAVLEIEFSIDDVADQSSVDTIDTVVDSILVDTADMQPRVQAIEVDTNEMQGKLPTNNIMGSSTKSDKDDEIDAIKADTDKLFDADMGSPSSLFDGSFADRLMNKDGSQTYDSSTDSLEAIATSGAIVDWSAAEREQIRDALGVDGTKTAATGGQLQGVKSQTDQLAFTTNNVHAHIKAKDSTLPLSAQEKADVNSEADQALTDYDPPTKAELDTAESNIIAEVNANETKIDAVQTDVTAILADTNEIQGKLPDDNIMGSSVTTSKDDEIDAILADTAAMDARLPTDPADQSLVEDKIDAAVDQLDGADDRDHTEIYDAITAVGSNVRLKMSVPPWMQKPDSGDKAYRWAANLYALDGSGPEDPDNQEILVRVFKDDGTFITANMYKENALSNLLDNPTDTVNFPPASGWRKMVRLGVGRFDLYYKVSDAETEEHLNIEFGFTEGGSSPFVLPNSTIVSDVKGDLEDIQSKVTALYDKRPDEFIMGSSVQTSKDDEIDAILIDTAVTIPTQINDQTTTLKALPDVKSTPDYLVVPSGRTEINQEGGITDIETTIAVVDVTQLGADGDEVAIKIESEYITGTVSTSTNELTGCTRGAFGSSNVAHADKVAVYQTYVYPLRLIIYDKELNMVAPDSAPTIAIDDWAGNSELSPTAMTLISTGLYSYNYIVAATDTPEPKVIKHAITIDSITTNRETTLMLLDEPATMVNINQVLGLGLGEFLINQDGWFDSDGILQEWGDSMEGYLRDAETGSRLDDVIITAYSKIGGEMVVAKIPPGQGVSDENGNYSFKLDAGTYRFIFYKDQYRFPVGFVDRTVGP